MPACRSGNDGEKTRGAASETEGADGEENYNRYRAVHDICIKYPQ